MFFNERRAWCSVFLPELGDHSSYLLIGKFGEQPQPGWARSAVTVRSTVRHSTNRVRSASQDASVRLPIETIRFRNTRCTRLRFHAHLLDNECFLLCLSKNWEDARAPFLSFFSTILVAPRFWEGVFVKASGAGGCTATQTASCRHYSFQRRLLSKYRRPKELEICRPLRSSLSPEEFFEPAA